jgi:transposase
MVRPVKMKRWEKKEFIQRSRRQGLSCKEIIARTPFSISKSTISEWCKDIELTERQKDRLDRLFREGSYRGRLIGPKITQEKRAKEVSTIRDKAVS